MGKRVRTATLAIPSLDRLADMLSGKEAARRAALSAGGRARGFAKARNRLNKARKFWKQKRTRTYGGRRIANGTAKLPSRLGIARHKAMVARMEPGVWYARSELVALLPEYAPQGARVAHWEACRAGLLERGLNADHDPACGNWMQNEPRYLYRLNEKGCEAREAWQAELSA